MYKSKKKKKCPTNQTLKIYFEYLKMIYIYFFIIIQWIIIYMMYNIYNLYIVIY